MKCFLKANYFLVTIKLNPDEVILEVDSSIKFFKQKFGVTQTILEEKENGNLIISYNSTNDMEIFPLIESGFINI